MANGINISTKGFPIKKISHRRGVLQYAPTNVEIIWDDLLEVPKTSGRLALVEGF